MKKGVSTVSRWPLLLVLVGVLASFLIACGGSGGGDGAGPLWVKRFSVPNFTGILLDEDLTLLFSTEIKESSLNHDSIRIRTGVSGGEAPRGTFVKGVFMVDPNTGTRVVIDPDQVLPLQVQQAENEGLVSLIPLDARYDADPAMKSPWNGNRKVLFDKSRGEFVTFVPEIPTRADLSDTGFKSAATYTIVVPSFPALNTVQNMDGDPLLPRYGQVFVSTFTTVPVTSPQPFLGGESELPPRVINTSPPNGATEQAKDVRVYIRFAQPLDPRSILPQNFFLTIISNSLGQQIPVSLFLRQTRLGTVEVILTPLQELPVGTPTDPYVFQVDVSAGVRDLLGKALTPFRMSFSTGGVPIVISNIVESFDTNANENTVVTTANWNAHFDYVGAETGALVAAYAPFAGSGAEGPFQAQTGEDTVLNTGTSSPIIHNYRLILVPIGARVFGLGNYGLVMRSQGSVTISGEVNVSGASGGQGGLGGSALDPPTGGPGGSAGPGGWGGGDGAMRVFDVTNFNGINGKGVGGGIAGRSGDQERDDGNPANRTREAVQREGGGGGAYATGGDAANASLCKAKPSTNPNNGGTGGTAYAAIVPPIVGTLDAGFGGSGGGGGGGEDDAGTAGAYGNGVADGWDEGGGGGGGGGGALQIISYGDMAIEGIILANGGDGGSTYNPNTGGNSQGAPGGSGSGGAIWLQTNRQLTIAAGSLINAFGGQVGQGDGNGNDNPKYGGRGGNGFIRLQDVDGVISIPLGGVDPADAGTVSQFMPGIVLLSTGQSNWYNQFIATPNFGDPVIEYTTGPVGENNHIQIYVQGAHENVDTPGPDPYDPDTDPDPTHYTQWRLIFDTTAGGLIVGEINILDNYQYLRFRVEFSVDPVHSFLDPLPKVTKITIPVSSIPD